MTHRKSGVSAVVIVRDEPWIEMSLCSILDVVDEIIVVDASSDDSCENVAKKLGVRYIRTLPSITEQFKLGLSMSQHTWILSWGADFVARVADIDDIADLFCYVSRLPKLFYYHIAFKVANLNEHFKINGFHRESYLFKYSCLLESTNLLRQLRKKIRVLCAQQKGKLPPRYSHNPLPFFYQKIVLDNVFALHIDVKSQKRQQERPYQPLWALMSKQEKEQFNNSFEEYVKSQL